MSPSLRLVCLEDRGSGVARSRGSGVACSRESGVACSRGQVSHAVGGQVLRAVGMNRYTSPSHGRDPVPPANSRAGLAVDKG